MTTSIDIPSHVKVKLTVKVWEGGSRGTVLKSAGENSAGLPAIDDDFDVVQKLVQLQANVDIQDNEGWTLLHAADSCGHDLIVRLVHAHFSSSSFLIHDLSLFHPSFV